MIGVSRDTIERARDELLKNPTTTPKTRTPQAAILGGLFAQAGKGGVVIAASVYAALNLTPTALSMLPIPSAPAPKAPKGTSATPRAATVTAEGLEAWPDKKLDDEFDQTVTKARADTGGRIPWARIKAIANELGKRLRPPSGMLHGQPLARIDLSRCEFLGSLGGLLRNGNQSDLWPFILPREGKQRPIDLLDATAADFHLGELVLLTLPEWYALLGEALSEERCIEHGLNEAQALGDGMADKTEPESTQTKKTGKHGGL
jgi:hypothetical protein